MKKFINSLLTVWFLLACGCMLNTDCRTCANCEPTLNVPLAFKVKKGLDSNYFKEFNFSDPFIKINNQDTLTKLQSLGYEIDTMFYSYNYRPEFFFHNNVDENIALFYIYFPSGKCNKWTADCLAGGNTSHPCCR